MGKWAVLKSPEPDNCIYVAASSSTRMLSASYVDQQERPVNIVMMLDGSRDALSRSELGGFDARLHIQKPSIGSAEDLLQYYREFLNNLRNGEFNQGEKLFKEVTIVAAMFYSGNSYAAVWRHDYTGDDSKLRGLIEGVYLDAGFALGHIMQCGRWAGSVTPTLKSASSSNSRYPGIGLIDLLDSAIGSMGGNANKVVSIGGQQGDMLLHRQPQPMFTPLRAGRNAADRGQDRIDEQGPRRAPRVR